MTETSGMLFSIVMPAYNEADVIAATVEELCGHLDGTGLSYELIIVDDASRDATPQIIADLAATYPAIRPFRNDGPNGYGYAIRYGLGEYRGDAVVVVTSDGSDAPKDVETYFRKIAEGFDCVFGDRFGGQSVVTNYPPVKKVINRISNRVLGWIVGGDGYRDFTNGFKCYRREVIEEMSPLITGQFNITIEMSLKAVLAGRRFAVVPTDWRQRDAGQSSFRVLNQFRPYLATLVYCLCRQYLMHIKR